MCLNIASVHPFIYHFICVQCLIEYKMGGYKQHLVSILSPFFHFIESCPAIFGKISVPIKCIIIWKAISECDIFSLTFSIEKYVFIYDNAILNIRTAQGTLNKEYMHKIPINKL